MFCDDVTEEVAKNTILNAINLAPETSHHMRAVQGRDSRQED